MKKIIFILMLIPVLIPAGMKLSAQKHYSDYKTLGSGIENLSVQYPALCTVKSIGKTAGGKEIRVIIIGTGDKDNKPGIAVVGGVDGSYILGRELSLGFAERLLKRSSTDSIKSLLSRVTFYVFPDVSPDASEQYFAGVKYERKVNSRQTDDDRDFLFNEDPFEDLDKDGYITHVRITDPSGTFTESRDDKRIMVEADLSEGRTGQYILIPEGIDNDKDEKFNEDGDGGVSFNANFTFNYEEFGVAAGLHPVSEPEVKAVSDYLFDRFNIYAVFTFGPQDNLGQPWKSNDQQKNERKKTAVMKSDETINKLVSDKYHSLTGAPGAPQSVLTPGNFMEWAYYHYGRYSFSTPGWWVPAEKGKNNGSAFLRYAEKNGITDIFVPWKEISHPDFPGKKAEAGGLRPFVLFNPPADSIEILADKHFDFITAIAFMHPQLEFIDVKTENAGEGVFRLTLKVHNKGIFSTVAEIGDFNTWTRIMRISLEHEKGQSLLSGEKVRRISRLEGDGTAEFSWLILGKGTVKITAGAVNTGIITSNIELR